ncbi:transglycosylase SLT domain-containing protein [Sphingobium boeckii]|uniref:Soluble lytic murein transglycosylase n=1 Tax=Sphingobium boeckii TaxID=1082345 RepID=A0A7W9EFK5_9SPHN|nr:transglycosylase SLT domain-containing protein [Sphingobium boeckii]MBB5687347.1 soluble lytic murein transglycosylase [Sphingobium boeckii]
MSSMLAKIIATGLLFSSSAALADTLNAQQKAYYRAQMSGLPASPTARTDPVGDALVQWNRLRRPGGYTFDSYANFLIRYPDWPGAEAMRRAAEKAINPAAYQPAQVLNYFDRLPALTTMGEVRYALALQAAGRRDEALASARRAWTGGTLTPDDEGRILALFAANLTERDHDKRMEKLLWDKAASSAVRQMPLTSQANRPLYAARLALQQKAVDAASKAAFLNAAQRNDPGYILDRANWLRLTGQSVAARALLAEPRTLTSPPQDANRWFEALLANAKAAVIDSQYGVAYDIASKVDDAYPAGVSVSDQSYAERDKYTDLVWLAGTVAMQNRNRPQDAIGMFDRYARGSRTAQTRAKGLYWAGRAALSAGQRDAANGYFTRAAAMPDQYYGQLASERLGLRLAAPVDGGKLEVTRSQRDAFEDRGIVKAAKLLGEMGDWKDQSLFLREIANTANTDLEHHFIHELAEDVKRPDLKVMIGRRARVAGFDAYVRDGFPEVKVPSGYGDNFTMIHAITRQESQFDRQAQSPVGARGLMQLMPGTAREQAGKLGIPYALESLTADTDYNIQLGSSYFDRMLRQFNGSYPMAVAAYNGGAGNVRKWIAANGDPRGEGGDMVGWIEKIPFAETRNYVQRVLENAVVYDLIHPERARSKSIAAPLSWYLGKKTPG